MTTNRATGQNAEDTMRKTFYDVSVKGEQGKWYPIGVASSPQGSQQVYDLYVTSGGIPGPLLVTVRTEDLFLNVGR